MKLNYKFLKKWYNIIKISKTIINSWLVRKHEAIKIRNIKLSKFVNFEKLNILKEKTNILSNPAINGIGIMN